MPVALVLTAGAGLLAYTFWLVFYVGINSAIYGTYAVSPVLAALGVQAHSPALLHAATWFSGPAGLFVVGTCVVLLIGYLQYRGAGGYFRWQRWATYVSLASLAVTLVVLALAAAGVLDFAAHFDSLAGAGSYHTVVTQGVAAGAAPAAPFSLARDGQVRHLAGVLGVLRRAACWRGASTG